MLSAERNAWAGYSFEMLCLNHQEQIKKALGVSGIMTKVSSWRAKTSDKNKILNCPFRTEVTYLTAIFRIKSRF